MGFFSRRAKSALNDSKSSSVRGITFKDNGKVVCTTPYGDDWSTRCPPVPQKPGYRVRWSDLDQITNEVNAVYEPIRYTITYYVEGEVYMVDHFTIDKEMYYPEVPRKDGYIVMWPRFSLEPRDIRVDAMVRPVSYSARIYVDGVPQRIVQFSVNNPIKGIPVECPKGRRFDVDEMPRLKPSNQNVFLTTRPIRVTFVTHDGKSKVIDYSKGMTNPPLKEDKWHETRWEDYEVGNQDVIVHEVFKPRRFDAAFYLDGEFVRTVGFSIDEPITRAPISPPMGYRLKGELPKPRPEDMRIDLESVPITISFITCDGKTIRREYSDGMAAPSNTEKPGYEVKWEVYKVGRDDICVNEVQEPIQYDARVYVNGRFKTTVPFTVEDTWLDLSEILDGIDDEVDVEYTIAPEDIDVNIRTMKVFKVTVIAPDGSKTIRRCIGSISNVDLSFIEGRRGYRLVEEVEQKSRGTVIRTSYEPVTVTFIVDGMIVQIKRFSQELVYPECKVPLHHHIQWMDDLGSILHDDAVIRGRMEEDEDYPWSDECADRRPYPDEGCNREITVSDGCVSEDDDEHDADHSSDVSAEAISVGSMLCTCAIDENKRIESHSWTVFGDTAIKKTDLSVFKHRGSTIPRDITFFFVSGSIKPGQYISVYLQYADNQYPAKVESIDNGVNQIRIRWGPEFSGILNSLYPDVLKTKDFPSMSLQKMDASHYRVSFSNREGDGDTSPENESAWDSDTVTSGSEDPSECIDNEQVSCEDVIAPEPIPYVPEPVSVKTSSDVLSDEQVSCLRSILTEAFYDMSEFSDVVRGFVDSFNMGYVSYQNCRNLGYHLRKSSDNNCVYRFGYSNPTMAFREYIRAHSGSLITISNEKLVNLTVYNELRKMMSDWTLFRLSRNEFLPRSLMMQKYDVSLDSLDEFIDAVWRLHPEGTFCMKQVRGLYPDDLLQVSNDDLFFESILISSKRFRTNAVRGVTLFSASCNPTLASVVEWLIRQGFYDLDDICYEINDTYGIDRNENSILYAAKTAGIRYKSDGNITMLYLDDSIFEEMADYGSIDRQ